MKIKIISVLIAVFALALCLGACNQVPEPTETSKPTDPPEHVHAFEPWSVVTEATCTAEGSMTRKCADCGENETHTVQKLEHTLESKVSAPTCDTQGYTHYKCGVCGYEFDADYVKPLGHDLEKTVTAPTCTSQGYTHYDCKTCDYEFDGDFIAPLAHQKTSAVRYHATVNRSGYTQYTCEDCGHICNEDFILYKDIVSGAYVDNTTVLKKGIDTSKWNHKTGATSDDLLPMDWAALKAAGVDFVILKAGSSIEKDPAFDADYEAAKAAGLEVGAYFYAYSTTVGGTVEDAGKLLGWLEGKQFEYPIYFDIEDSTLETLDKEHLTDMCVAFAEVLQDNGYYAAVYANHNWVNNILNKERITSSFDVWYARYYWDLPDGSSSFALGDEIFVWQESWGKNFGMWQHTQCGNIEGFECDFDFDYAYKDYASLMKQWGLNGF